MTTEMIVKELPRIATGDSGVVKKVTVVQSWTPTTYDVGYPNETKRRNIIIEDMVRKSPLTPGMRVRPKDDSTYADKGAARISAIAQNYKEWKGNVADCDVKWPSGDNPTIVHAQYEDDNFCVEATINYFVPLPEGDK